MIDQVIQIPVLLFEETVGTIYSLTGVVGTIFNPMDTLNSIIGGTYLIIKSVVLGIIDIFLTLFLVAKSIF